MGYGVWGRGLPVGRNGLLVVGVLSGPTNGKEGGVQTAPLLLESPFYATDQAYGDVLAGDACPREKKGDRGRGYAARSGKFSLRYAQERERLSQAFGI